MKFDFSKSTDADFRNKLQSNLDILMSNVLYITHELDHIKKLVLTLSADNATQRQVDEFYEPSEHALRTSPQTETDEQ